MKHFILFVIEAMIAAWNFKSAVKEWKNEEYFTCGMSLVAFICFTAVATKFFMNI